MKVFLDECVDWRLGRHITGHEVKTARDMGWTAIKNGALLRLASGAFDVFVTTDRNLAFQQNLSTHAVAVIALHAKSNRLADLLTLLPQLLASIDNAAQGGVTDITEGPQSP